MDRRGDAEHGTHRHPGVALKKDLVRVTVKNVPDRLGIAAKIFGDIAAANVSVDDIIQNVMDDNTANISFTVEHGDLADTGRSSSGSCGNSASGRRRRTRATWRR